MTLDLTNFTPIADILVLEKRTCRKCGFGSVVPSHRILRLWTSHTGPHVHTLEPRKDTDTPLANRGVEYVETIIESCLNCWSATDEWEDLKAISPAPPSGREASPLNGFAHTAERVMARASLPGVSREARNRVQGIVNGAKPPTLEELLA